MTEDAQQWHEVIFQADPGLVQVALNDPPTTGWTVDWGDGTTDTVAMDEGVAEHRYENPNDEHEIAVDLHPPNTPGEDPANDPPVQQQDPNPPEEGTVDGSQPGQEE